MFHLNGIVEKLDQGMFEVKNSLPYADIEHMDDPYTKKIAESDGFIRLLSCKDESFISTSKGAKALNVQCQC